MYLEFQNIYEANLQKDTKGDIHVLILNTFQLLRYSFRKFCDQIIIFYKNISKVQL